tara:strand:+ start:1388 stop:1519 length:132 start_codon:yes stop_codon:yes gene_type:complete
MGDTIYFYPGYRWEPTPKNWEELTEEECLEILGLSDERNTHNG